MGRVVRPQIRSKRREDIMEDNHPKQVIVIRRDLGMRRGKEIAQGSHASMKFLVDAVLDLEKTGELNIREAAWEWMSSGHFTKVTVQVDTEAEMLSIFERAKEAGLLASLIQDEGVTEFNNVPTYTAVAIGPDYPDKLAPVTGSLLLY